MPKAYSELEKQIIRGRLIAAGQKFINSLGIRRITVDDVIREAGISKGGFYNFFPSREDFIVTVFEGWEDQYRANFLASIQESALPIPERWEKFFVDMIQLLDEQPGLAQLQSADVEFLMARLPPERLAAHQERDQAVIQHAMTTWLDTGLINPQAAAALPGLIAALFSIALHRKDFKAIDFSAAVRFIAGALADKMSGGIA